MWFNIAVQNQFTIRFSVRIADELDLLESDCINNSLKV